MPQLPSPTSPALASPTVTASPLSPVASSSPEVAPLPPAIPLPAMPPAVIAAVPPPPSPSVPSILSSSTSHNSPPVPVPSISVPLSYPHRPTIPILLPPPSLSIVSSNMSPVNSLHPPPPSSPSSAAHHSSPSLDRQTSSNSLPTSSTCLPQTVIPSSGAGEDHSSASAKHTPKCVNSSRTTVQVDPESIQLTSSVDRNSTTFASDKLFSSALKTRHSRSIANSLLHPPSPSGNADANPTSLTCADISLSNPPSPPSPPNTNLTSMSSSTVVKVANDEPESNTGGDKSHQSDADSRSGANRHSGKPKPKTLGTQAKTSSKTKARKLAKRKERESMEEAGTHDSSLVGTSSDSSRSKRGSMRTKPKEVTPQENQHTGKKRQFDLISDVTLTDGREGRIKRYK